MQFDPVHFQNKLGQTVLVRSALEEDAALLQYLRETTAETPFLLREPEEVTMTLEQEKAFIHQTLAAPRSLMLAAFCDGRLAGTCSFAPAGPFRRYTHRCEIAIALYQDFCGHGIGEKLMELLLEQARAAGFEQAELEVVSDNKAALTLYQKLGFVSYGMFPHNMKYADGQYASATWMMKPL